MRTAPRIELDSALPDAVDGRQIRAVAFQEARMEYLQTVMTRHGLPIAGGRALVVGGGRSPLPAGLASLGFEVHAVDPSERATRLAAAIPPAGEDLRISYRTGTAEELDVPSETFELAYYADTFEITDNLSRVLEQASGALKPDGLLVYDTVNRTGLSRLVYLGAFQGFPFTRIMPPGRYTAARLRKPTELVELLRRQGLHNEDICDFRPRSPARLLNAVVSRRRGTITDDQIPAAVDMVLAPGSAPVVTYLGYARKL